MSKTAGWLIITSLVLLLSACTNPTKPVRSTLHTDMQALLAGNAERESISSLRRLQESLAYFEQIDELTGQWHANSAMANWHMTQGDLANAQAYAARGLDIAKQLQKSEFLYVSAMQMGQLTLSNNFFSLALRNANSEIEKALALTMMEDFASAETEITSLPEEFKWKAANEMGFILYRVGKHKSDLDYVLRAREYYHYADNVFGVVDSLFLAAQLQGNEGQAMDYADRALRAAKQTKSTERVRVISTWIAKYAPPEKR